MIRVEEARALDALPTLALHREVIEEGRHFVTLPEEFTETLEEREQHIEVARADPTSTFLVARLEDVRVAGFLTVRGCRPARLRHVGRMEMMVDARFRRQGVGRALLGQAIDWAAATGAIRKLSLAVFADNAAAITLYRSFGFVDEGRRIGEYREADGRLRGDLMMARFVG
jgi:ribosomal protein S18 acetylase RimI-like enzyme